MNKSFFVWIGVIVAGLLLGMISTETHQVAPSTRKQRTNDLQLAGTDALNRSTEKDLIGAALTALTGQLDLQGLARLGEVLPLLCGDAIRELLNRLERSSPETPSSQLEWLFSWLLSHNKEAATAWITPRMISLAQDGPRDPLYAGSGLGKMFVTWAAAEPDGAIAFARRYPNLGIAEQLLTAAISKLAEQDKSRGIAALLKFPASRARTSALASVLTEWAKHDSPAAFTAASRLEPGTARDVSISAVLSQWAEIDASGALEGYRSAGLNDAAVLGTVLDRLAKTDPAAAVAALEGLTPNEFIRCSSRFAVGWARIEPAAALSWAMERGLSLGEIMEVETHIDHHSTRRVFATTERMLGSLLGGAFATQPDATRAWLRSLPAGAERDEVYELAATASPNAEIALELFAGLSTEAAARVAYDIANKFARDPTVHQHWLESLPPGPVRQQGFAGLGASGFGAEPTRTEDRDALLIGRLRSPNTYRIDLKEVIRINDPTLRKDMFEMAFDNFRGTEEARARVIQNAMDEAGLSEEWKRRLLE